MIAADILLDGFFAAVAAVGFGAVSDPPMRAFPRIALLAAVGHALRFCLMNCAGMDIATASLCAATAIGFGSLWLGKAIRCPMTALYIPALLPMVPGIYAYKTVFSLIMFLQSLNDPGQGMQYMQLFFLNATVSLSVIALLAATAEMADHHPETPVITMSMGTLGAVSRLCGEAFGSAMTFANPGAASAPGQVPLDVVNEVLESLHAER